MNKSFADHDLTFLENYLNSALQPVHPRQEFISHMRNRVSSPLAQKRTDASSMGRNLFIVLGFVSSLLIIISTVRAVVNLRQSYRIVRQQQR
jgi:hypothetical protein